MTEEIIDDFIEKVDLEGYCFDCPMPDCDKRIESTSKKQLIANIKIHLETRHPEDVIE